MGRVTINYKNCTSDQINTKKEFVSRYGQGSSTLYTSSLPKRLVRSEWDLNLGGYYIECKNDSNIQEATKYLADLGLKIDDRRDNNGNMMILTCCNHLTKEDNMIEIKLFTEAKPETINDVRYMLLRDIDSPNMKYHIGQVRFGSEWEQNIGKHPSEAQDWFKEHDVVDDVLKELTPSLAKNANKETIVKILQKYLNNDTNNKGSNENSTE